MIHANGERHNYGSKNTISDWVLYFTTDTEAHVTIGKRNYGSRNTISDRDLYLTQDDTSKHKHTGRQEQSSARYIQMQGHNATRRQAPPDHEQWLFCIILRDVQMFLLKIALDWE